MSSDHYQLDAQQETINQILAKIAQNIYKTENSWQFLQNIFSPKIKQNIYLYGKVGCGKTMLMRKFYDQFKLPKKIIHFQQFMHGVHKKTHYTKSQKVPMNKIIHHLAENIAQECKLLCLDEFEIHDIADAMLIMQLFKALQAKKVIIFLTTNVVPKNLYKDGLQREAFMPFIDAVYQNFEILNLNSDIDYRYRKLSNQQRIITPSTPKGKELLAQTKHEILDGRNAEKVSIHLFGREVKFRLGTKETIFTDFEELFERSLSYADYDQVTSEYSIFIVENVRKIEDSETDIAIRFINFIDNAYYNKILLFLASECELDQLYHGKKKAEFQRTISRLHEMNSDSYTRTY